MKNLPMLSERFAEQRGVYEVEFARAMLALHHEGAVIADKLGIEADHFQVHPDMRLLFCACMACRSHSHARLMRVAKLAIERSHPLWIQPLERFTEMWDAASLPMWTLAMFQNGARLVRMHIAERNAREHIMQARRLISREVAA